MLVNVWTARYEALLWVAPRSITVAYDELRVVRNVFSQLRTNEGHCQPVPARSRLSGTGGWTEELRGRVARLHGVAGQEIPVEVEGAVHLFVGLDL